MSEVNIVFISCQWSAETSCGSKLRSLPRRPISPYLFLFISEGLPRLLQRASELLTIHSYHVYPSSPAIFHLLLVDDLLFMGRGRPGDGNPGVTLKYGGASS